MVTFRGPEKGGQLSFSMKVNGPRHRATRRATIVSGPDRQAQDGANVGPIFVAHACCTAARHVDVKVGNAVSNTAQPYYRGFLTDPPIRLRSHLSYAVWKECGWWRTHVSAHASLSGRHFLHLVLSSRHFFLRGRQGGGAKVMSNKSSRKRAALSLHPTCLPLPTCIPPQPDEHRQAAKPGARETLTIRREF